MITGRPIIAGLMCLPFRDLAAFGGDIQPQKDVMLRPRLARLHPCCAPLPPPLGRARAVRGSRRHWSAMFLKLQGDGSRVPPRTWSLTHD
jgi:hypothetical protein